MSNTVIAALAILTFIIVTVPVSLVAVLITRGQYYKELPNRVKQLEEKDTKSFAEIQRLRALIMEKDREIETLREMVTGHAELQAMVDLIRTHDREAAQRHADIVGKIESVKRAMAERQRDGG